MCCGTLGEVDQLADGAEALSTHLIDSGGRSGALARGGGQVGADALLVERHRNPPGAGDAAVELVLVALLDELRALGELAVPREVLLVAGQDGAVLVVLQRHTVVRALPVDLALDGGDRVLRARLVGAGDRQGGGHGRHGAGHGRHGDLAVAAAGGCRERSHRHEDDGGGGTKRTLHGRTFLCIVVHGWVLYGNILETVRIRSFSSSNVPEGNSCKATWCSVAGA